MSWWTDFRDAVEVVAPVVIAIVAPELAPAIGAELGFTEAAAAQAAGQAVISGTSTALQGGSPEDIAKSAAGGAVGSVVGGEVAGQPAGINEFTGDIITPPTGAIAATGSVDAGRALGSAAGRAASGLVRGETPEQALTSGAISGLTGYVFPEKSEGFERSLASTALSQLLAPSKRVTPAAALPGAGAGAAERTQSQYTPSSSALGQALRTDMGGPIFGGGKDDEGKSRSGWNVESLRYMGGGE